jgi:hypothetical protein
MKTRTIEDWRITELFVELEMRVAAHKHELTNAGARNADDGFIKLLTGKWYESLDALALVRSFLEELEDIEASKERIDE